MKLETVIFDIPNEDVSCKVPKKTTSHCKILHNRMDKLKTRFSQVQSIKRLLVNN